MLYIDQDPDFENMGYAFSRLEMETEALDGLGSNEEPIESPRPNRQSSLLENDIAQLTKLQSGPQENLSRVFPGKREFPVSTLKMLAGREANLSGKGRFTSGDCRHVLSRYLPVNGPSIVDHMVSRAYVSQFSADGSLFVAAFQGSEIRIYDVEKGWKVRKNVLARNLRWTITDTSLSPDQRHLVYASMSPIVHIVDIGSSTRDSLANINEIHESLDFSCPEDRGYSFGIFSLKFSNDGREIVAGSSDEDIYVYDLVANKLSLRISAHTSDVNTVCFADESGHLIYSGSDDNFCKVWDRRCLRSNSSPAGYLTGHLEGITFLDSRGDGPYRNYEWDYRWMDYPSQARNLKHPYDQSIATYKGHSVLRTLIRCYFSPEYSGAQVAKLRHHRSTVRDCSWHPNYPMLVSSSWDGDIVKWEFPGNLEVTPPANKTRPRRRYFFY
ncbi:transducin family protein / WD-40 repeat family protein, partial [Striga asiatica]